MKLLKIFMVVAMIVGILSVAGTNVKNSYACEEECSRSDFTNNMISGDMWN